MKEILVPSLIFVVGIVLIFKGGDIFVDSASWFGEVTGIPKFIIGATIVSLATTLPELLVSVMATAQGSVDMAIGNAIGSVACNMGLIMGICIVVLPSKTEGSFKFKSLAMVVATVLLGVFSYNGNLSILESIVLFVILGIYIYQNITEMKSASAEQSMDTVRERPDAREITINVIKFVGSAAAIVIGARLLVDNGSILARFMGVPESVIGLTIVAVGTSLPELVTTISALVKKEASMSVGNIIGANLIDITMILSVCSFISGGNLKVATSTIMVDIPFTLLIMVCAILPSMFSKKLKRYQGVCMLGIYGVYVATILSRM